MNNDTTPQNNPTEIEEGAFPVAEEMEQGRTLLLKGMPVFQQLTVALGILVLVFGATYISDLRNFLSPNDTEHEVSKDLTGVSGEGYNKKSKSFEDLTIEGKSAYVWDIKNQRALYNKNADEQLPLASITKLMTALVAYELLGEDASVNITIDALGQDGDSGLLVGEQFSLRNLTDLTLITSSNDGAYALAAAASASIPSGNYGTKSFVELMNIRAEEIGLSRTQFRNTTGLDTSEIESGAYGSARDVAFLMEYLVTQHPSILEVTSEGSTYIADRYGLTHEASNTNYHAEKTSGLIASKTGYTSLAGGNLVVAFDAGLNHPVIVTVLGSSYDGRFSDVASLIEATKQFLANQ